jgi:hypothetical protein
MNEKGLAAWRALFFPGGMTAASFLTYEALAK